MHWRENRPEIEFCHLLLCVFDKWPNLATADAEDIGQYDAWPTSRLPAFFFFFNKDYFFLL